MLLLVVSLLAISASGLLAGDIVETLPRVRTIKGELIQWRIQGLAGAMAIRIDDNSIERCRVLEGSRLMRAGIRIHPHGVRLGDTVEVEADYGGGRCNVLKLHIRPFQGERKMVNGKYRSPLYPRAYLDALWARGLLTFSGIVGRIDDGRLFIRMREHGERSFALRDDTVFQYEGVQVERDTLEAYTRVFVRASRTADGDLEAYQVLWGQILRPGH